MTYAASDFTVISDDTISRPSADALDKLWAALNDYQYLRVQFTKKVIESECIRLVAARRTQATGLEHQQELIHCLTIGPPLFVARSESKRATRVYRVVVEEDLDNNNLNAPLPVRVYALKDLWHEIGRREEVDFYDLVARHCAENGIDMEKAGMARCHGNLNLDRPGPHLIADWDLASHGTAKRHHTRILLSPVGRPIHEFPSTMKLAAAFHAAVIHLKIAYDAGVLHRDVSANNVLLVEDPSSKISGFLVDYDCAEMTENGVKLFNAWFNARTRASWKESKQSLLDRTGTFPFMAIEMIEANEPTTADDISGDRDSSEGAVDGDADMDVDSDSDSAHPDDEEDDQEPSASPSNKRHDLHHDLESIYWVLLGTLLAIISSDPPEKRTLFRREITCVPIVKKAAYGALRTLFQVLASLVNKQNPMNAWDADDPTPAVQIEYDHIHAAFKAAVESDAWPLVDDPAEPYIPNRTDDMSMESESAHEISSEAGS
uniref:Fungal-type protein kinase domain-containing protein n=1 Tax=Mycena chlorophos TaxID=658473 RepID=A0ABQ0LE16_MYCCL|nr:predicted protein [Mycena chlorophos]